MAVAFLNYVMDILHMRQPFRPECMIYVGLHVIYLDYHIARIDKKYFKFDVKEEYKYFIMLSMLRSQLKIYNSILYAVQDGHFAEALRIFQVKMGVRSEMINFFQETANRYRAEYRVTRRTMLKDMGEGYQDLVKIFKRMGPFVNESFANFINNPNY